MARFAPYGGERVGWVVKQALDVGLMGILFPPSRREIRHFSRSGTCAIRRTTDRATWIRLVCAETDPTSQRGSGVFRCRSMCSERIFGPLNPDGDLLALTMIESAEGLKNINDIAAVPGVAGFYAGDNDLSNSLGVALGSPESEAAIDTIAKACQTHRLPAVSAPNLPKPCRSGSGKASGFLAEEV